MTDNIDLTDVIMNEGAQFRYVFNVRDKKGEILKDTAVTVKV